MNVYNLTLNFNQLKSSTSLFLEIVVQLGNDFLQHIFTSNDYWAVFFFVDALKQLSISLKNIES